MKNWTKEKALSALTSLIVQIVGLKSEIRNSANHMRWIANTLRTLQEIFGQNSTYYQTEPS